MILAFLLSIVAHEGGHITAALLRGDRTPIERGRLNPLSYIDPAMTILAPLMSYVLSGGAIVAGGLKPVPLGPNTPIHVFAAGIYAHVVLAGVGLLWWHDLFVVNVVLAAFNAVPLPPLDGHYILRRCKNG